MDWHGHLADVVPHIVRIRTPERNGTGFLVHRREGQVWIATASHVLRDAKTWEQMVTIEHPDFSKPLQLLPNEEQRRMWLHRRLDSACIAFKLPELLAARGRSLFAEPCCSGSLAMSN